MTILIHDTDEAEAAMVRHNVPPATAEALRGYEFESEIIGKDAQVKHSNPEHSGWFIPPAAFTIIETKE